MKSGYGIALLICAGLWIYRIEIFNLVVTYEPNTELRAIPIMQGTISESVDDIVDSKSYVGFIELNRLLLKHTSSNLNFSSNQNFKSINDIEEKGNAHCVGFASYHTSVLSYAIQRMNSDSYSIEHVRGSIHLFGLDLTDLTDSPFFQDHDFIRIRNKNLDKEYFCDPSLYELLRIDRVKLKNGI